LPILFYSAIWKTPESAFTFTFTFCFLKSLELGAGTDWIPEFEISAWFSCLGFGIWNLEFGIWNLAWVCLGMKKNKKPLDLKRAVKV